LLSRRLYRRAAVYDHRLVHAGVHLPAFSPDTTNSFARGWLDLSLKYREQLMLPWYLSMGVMTFFISVGIGASLVSIINSTRS
jgi:cellobiose-specific phosphotransferase system component IIC